MRTNVRAASPEIPDCLVTPSMSHFHYRKTKNRICTPNEPSWAHPADYRNSKAENMLPVLKGSMLLLHSVSNFVLQVLREKRTSLLQEMRRAAHCICTGDVVHLPLCVSWASQKCVRARSTWSQPLYDGSHAI